jgi:hypothetical protein
MINTHDTEGCSKCLAGKFNNGSLEEDVTSFKAAVAMKRFTSGCHSCARGLYGEKEGASRCKACLSGFYQSALAQTSCLKW